MTLIKSVTILLKKICTWLTNKLLPTFLDEVPKSTAIFNSEFWF